MLAVSEISNAEGLSALREEWDDLLTRSKNAGIFQTWEWVSTTWKYYGRGKKILIACVRDGDRLVGLAPFEITRMYALPLRRLQIIGTGTSDYLDFILDSEHEVAAAEAVLGWLNDSDKRWDLLDLQQFPEDSPTLGTLGASPVQGEIVVGEHCPYLPLADTWEEMLPRFGKKTRSNIGYYERITRRDFAEVTIGALGESELDEGMDAFFELHTQRWRKRWLPGMLVGAARQGFHREVARLCLNRGWLRLYGLRLDGVLRAVLYCYAFNGRAYYYLGGFDPTLSKYSIGTVLTGFAIRDSIENGCREFDFLRGDEPYKYRWTDSQRTNSRLILPSRTLGSHPASAICRLEQRVEHRVKHELHKRLGAG